LAVNRAEKEKQLLIKLQFSAEKISEFSSHFFIPQNPNSSLEYLKEAIDDGLERLLLPSIERELRADKKRRSDESAIKVF
jgi:competence protein comEA helix-hairpin-helix region